jgi:thymidylate synthase
MNKLDLDYQNLLKDILENGIKKETRNGGTISVFGRQIRHKMSEGFPLLTTKKMSWKSIVTELLWFLRGDTNIQSLVQNNCHIWDGDAYKNYLKHNDEVSNYWIKKNPEIESRWKPYLQEEFINKIKTDDEFAKTWGELGKIYGAQWRSWKYMGPKPQQEMLDENTNWPWKITEIDQIANLISDLKTNPDSRRLMVNAWNVGELDQMVLPPCHYSFQVYTRELSLKERYELMKKLDSWVSVHCKERKTMEYMDKHNIPARAISLMWNQRSVDTFLGLPFNIASYGLLLMMIADEVNMVPDELIGNLGDVHLYLNHIEQAKEQIGRDLSIEERYEIALPIWKEKYGPLADMMVPTNVDNIPYKIPTRTREPYPLPTVHIRDGIFCSSVNDIILENYQSHPTIKAPLSN